MADLTPYFCDLRTYSATPADCECTIPQLAEETTAATDVTCVVFDLANPVREATDPADALGQWYEHRLPGDPVAACLHGGAVHYLDADGTVRYEDEGKVYDETSTQIRTKEHFAPLSLVNIGGAVRVYRVQLDGNSEGAVEMTFGAEISVERRGEPEQFEKDFDVEDGEGEVELYPVPQRATTVEYTLEEAESDVRVKGYKLRALELELGTDGKLRRLDVSQRKA
jgi:hypothetical protein